MDEEDLASLKLLEARNTELFLDREKEWRIKSKATWVDVGDHNTSIFHKFSNHKKRKNTIWEFSNR